MFVKISEGGSYSENKVYYFYKTFSPYSKYNWNFFLIDINPTTIWKYTTSYIYLYSSLSGYSLKEQNYSLETKKLTIFFCLLQNLGDSLNLMYEAHYIFL